MRAERSGVRWTEKELEAASAGARNIKATGDSVYAVAKYVVASGLLPGRSWWSVVSKIKALVKEMQ